ncbi:sulfurtransferase TusA family protein [Sphingomonas sp. AP4-R1]|uniref:sulfurtransferase TusA family protein n=1 Tax=Sphingomonas sp. AP4-R1 TaxID=2735134 RepID=UPI0014937F43|nr:sulfurtransferase TusA family protein [Sphingomonas sp. AP4-R1]QJU60836.1 sulfurtransferase TusA family protein [Sphingomonas sp. AP4-R1]
MRCPWPALRLAKAMRTAVRVRIAADDPRAAAEFRALCEEQGWSIVPERKDFIVTRAMEGKP